MNLKEIVQKFCMREGIPVPNFVIGSTDPQVLQLGALVEDVLESMVRQYTWSALTKQAVFTTVAGEDQGLINDIAPQGFKFILNETIFNRTLRLPFYGPVNPTNWQALKAIPNPGPFYRYRLVGGHLLVSPVMPEGHVCAFEYMSNYAVQGTDGVFKRYPTKDDDTFVLDDDIILVGVAWTWKSKKGLDYAEEFRRFEELCGRAAAGDATKPRISMDNPHGNDFQPGVFVPFGNWPL